MEVAEGDRMKKERKFGVSYSWRQQRQGASLRHDEEEASERNHTWSLLKVKRDFFGILINVNALIYVIGKQRCYF